MPYRRLPTTDQARRRALAKALEMGSIKIPSELAFSQQTLENIRAFHPEFEKALLHYQSCLRFQVEKNQNYSDLVRKARVYISHFIQVLNLAIAREEIHPQDREYYGLKKNETTVPSLTLETEIMDWGDKIIQGEQARIENGGSPLYSPSIALVKVHYSTFCDAFHLQKTLQANTSRALEKIADLRETADSLIRTLWNEIELHYQYMSPKHKRQITKEYGIVYIYRKKELRRLNPEEMQTDLIFEM
jgi:hypothetical protein